MELTHGLDAALAIELRAMIAALRLDELEERLASAASAAP